MAVMRHRWRTSIKNAADEKALLAVVNEYLGEWTWGEMAQLPNAAWPMRIDNAKSLSEWTFRLGELHREFQGRSSGTLAGIEELLLFFTHASVRMAQLARPKTSTDTDA
ncbi:MAG TPA: hypothetical protein VFP44_24195 [Usitatibacter sp.]|nr:hypothetical protein [Usitatibacter sp.]